MKLDGAAIVDEDTTVYNPGPTLLSGAEKTRLVDALVDNRAAGLAASRWSEDNEDAFVFLKGALDPLHTHKLAGYLGILPMWGAALYLAATCAEERAGRLSAVSAAGVAPGRGAPSDAAQGSHV